MAEPDPVDELEKLGKQLASTFWEIIKSRIGQKQQAEAEEQQQEMSKQLAMEQQQKLLDGFREIMREQNPTVPQKQEPLTPEQTKALDDLAQRETALNDSIKKIDDRLDQIDAEQESILNPGVGGPPPDTEKLRKLQEERSGLKKDRQDLNKELTGLSGDRESIRQGKIPQPKPEPIAVDKAKVGGEVPDTTKVEPPKVEVPKVETPKLDPQKLEAQKLEAQKIEVQRLEAQLEGVERRLDEIQLQQDYLNKVPKEQWTPEDNKAVDELQKEQATLKKQQANVEGQLEKENQKLKGQEISAKIEGTDNRLREIQEQQDYLKKVPKDQWKPEDDQAVAELAKEETALKTQKVNLEKQLEKHEAEGIDLPEAPELGVEDEPSVELGMEDEASKKLGPELGGKDEPEVGLDDDTLGLDEDAMSLNQNGALSWDVEQESPKASLGKGPKAPELGSGPKTEGVSGEGVGTGQIRIKIPSKGVVSPKSTPSGESDEVGGKKFREGSTGASLEKSGYFKKKMESFANSIKTKMGGPK